MPVLDWPDAKDTYYRLPLGMCLYTFLLGLSWAWVAVERSF